MIHVFLADDHAVLRDGLRYILEEQNDITVIGDAADGWTTVQQVKQLHPDVVIMDISMPRLNGIEATKQIKEFQPSAVILVLTAYDYEQYIFPLLEAGAAGYLLKDVSSHELIRAIQSVAKGDAVLHPAVAQKVLEHFKQAPDRLERQYTSELLTERETAVLKMAAKGMTNSDIAETLHLSVRTVESHLGTIFNKLGVGSRTEAVIQAMKKGWLTLEELS